jgi:glutamate-1-semialdehyde 2,1-aminomutase
MLVSRLHHLEEHNIQVIYAIPITKENDLLYEHLSNSNCNIYRGSEINVAERFAEAAKEFNIEHIIRITADCPFIDYNLIIRLVKEYEISKSDYASNTINPTFPDGLDVEVFSKFALETTLQETTSTYDLEHVTTYIKRHDKFKKLNVENSRDMSYYRVTLDTPNDLINLNLIYGNLSGVNFSYRELEENLIKLTPDQMPNHAENLKYGYHSLPSVQMWERALNVIPGGTMLFSKRKENNLPEGWPTYFLESSGCEILSIDGKTYYDFGLMGVGTSILGYSNPEINLEVQKSLATGNLTTLLPPQEVLLAEKLIELHPWASKAMFTRSGGEALAVAIRIARAFSGKQKIAICGYHGWHDWYLSGYKTNSELMSKQFIDGLTPTGIAENLDSSSVPFEYNKINSLLQVLKNNAIAAIVMEVERNEPPIPEYLQNVRALADEYNVPLIFDECTSGFRKIVGGLHLHYGIEPDIATFGKTLGNGFAIAAVIGNEKLMSSVKSTFISSSFWSEKIGYVAALKTLEIMQRDQIPDYIDQLGLEFKKRLIKFSLENNIDIDVRGIPAISTFNIKGFDPLIFQSFITQKMLEKYYLARNSIYFSSAHSEKFKEYCENLFEVIHEANYLGELKVKSILSGNIVKTSIRKKNFEQ